jgi:hypothetical protein
MVKIKIKSGTPVSQDHHFFDWPGRYADKADTVFTVERLDDEKIICRARGFGILGHGAENYGNGAIFMRG